ncbi:MAG: iron-containing alcohol dehydrogenase [Firmicutes bacterium]|jgi:alcohol dehydrogenase class IV|nr:iron-containing alcohol dehydrogenase [Bacillota bacterium]
MTQTEELSSRARALLNEFKGDSYSLSLQDVGKFAADFGTKALVIGNQGSWLAPTLDVVASSLNDSGTSIAGDRIAPGSAPNSPVEDVYRIAEYIVNHTPDCLVAVGGGSTIDAVKAANVIACLGGHDPDVEDYVGVGLVTEAISRTGKRLIPMIAVQTASGSGAHLTKYSNITFTALHQKKLIIDDEVTPDRAIFDYSVTRTARRGLTLDGAFDGLSHCLEVFYGIGPEHYDLAREIAGVGIELIVANVQNAIEDPKAHGPREALGLATDLGGYAIMVGATNGGHLTSFSLVDITSHGRACAVMNPYYTVFFAPAIESQLKIVGDIFKRYGYISADIDGLSGRDLGIAVAQGMIDLSRAVGFPATLSELPGFTDSHIERALRAAKNPQLKSKLESMPVHMDASSVDTYMKPVLEAAKRGDFRLIVNM